MEYETTHITLQMTPHIDRLELDSQDYPGSSASSAGHEIVGGSEHAATFRPGRVLTSGHALNGPAVCSDRTGRVESRQALAWDEM